MSASALPERLGPDQALAGLDTGHLTRFQLSSLSLATFSPAAGMAMTPVVLFSSAGYGSWLAAAITALATVGLGLAVVTFARRHVATGSLYSYVGTVFGPWARCVVGAGLVVGFVAQVSTIAAGIGLFGGSFLFSLGVDGALGNGPQTGIYVLAIGISALVAYRGLDASVRVAVTLAVLSVPLLILVTGASAAHTGLDLSRQVSMEGSTLTGVFQGMAAGAALLVGFESCASLAAETRAPRRNVPLAVMIVPVVLGGLYLVTTVLQVPGLAAASTRLEAGVSPPAALALEAGLGSGVAKTTDLVLAVATFAALIGFINYGSRFAATLAADGLLPVSLAKVHPRYRSPGTAVIALSVLGMATMVVLVQFAGGVLAAFNTSATLMVYAWVVPYLLLVGAVVVETIGARTLRPLLLIGSLAGGGTMAWLYLNGILNPPESPVDAMSWVNLVATVVLALAFVLLRRRGEASSQDE